MEKRAFIGLIILFVAIKGLIAQTYNQTIHGTVIDADTKELITGAAVAVSDMNPMIGTMTNERGVFLLENVPVGRHSIKVNFIGYKEVQLSEILVSSGRQTVLTIELIPSISELKEVKVVAESSDKDKSLNTMASISARRLNMDEASRYAGGLYDAARMASSFAGVAGAEGDGVNDIVIRGNSPRGLLWRLEGVEIPNPNHFTDGQGGTGGAISVITSNALASSDFLTGAFPAEYGNAFSGVMDLNLRKGNTEKREYAVQLGVIGVEASAEGPLSKAKNASFMINYRYSALDLLSRANVINLGDNNLPPRFQDLSFTLHVPNQKYGSITLFGVGGQSTTGTEPVKDSMYWKKYVEGRNTELENHAMGVLGLKHFVLLPNKKTSLRTTIASTMQYDAWDAGYLQFDYQKKQTYNDRFAYPSLKAHLLLNHRFNHRHIVSLGGVSQQLFYSMYQKYWSDSLKNYQTAIDQSGNSSILQMYAQWKYRVTERFEINSGLHALYFALNGNKSLEPRVGMRYQIAQRSFLNAGFGLHSRIEAIPTYCMQIKQADGSMKDINRNVDFTKAYHFVVGLNHLFTQQLRAKIEAYYQELSNVPVVATPQSPESALNFSYGIPTVALNNTGKGMNYGVELTLERFYSNNFYFLLTTSLFESKYKNYDLPWRNTVFNNQYVSNFLGGRDFKFGKDKQHTIGVNGKLLWRGGFCTTPINRALSLEKHTIIYDTNNLLSEHLPAFTRVDMGVSLRINRQRYSYTLAINIQNVANRPVVLGYEYSEKLQDIKPVYGMGLMPILNYRLEF